MPADPSSHLDRHGTVVLTGASGGIGRAVLEPLLARGPVCALLRDPHALDPRPGLERVRCDLADLGSVGAVARRLAQGPPVSALIHGAGSIHGTRALSSDGHELTLAVHHLALVRLFEGLRPALQPGARVITVASRAHRLGVFDFGDPALARGYGAMRAYRRAKLAAVAWSGELAHRHPELVAISLHPGVIDTAIGARGTSALVRLGWWLMGPFKEPPERAAERILRALDAGPERSGAHLEGDRWCAAAPRALDPVFRERLWWWSREAAGLAPLGAPER